MGQSLCGGQGTEYLCNNRHVMNYMSIAQNPEDILNQSSPSQSRVCVFCNRGVQQCGAQVCWGCTKCKFYYCAHCKGYKIDVCPANHALATKSFTQKEDAFCDVCSSPIINSALHCNKCKFNVCNICENAKKSNKSNKK